MPAITPEQVSEIVDAGFNILKDAADLTSGRDPNYIRDAQPANVIDAVGLAAARQGCRRYQQKGGDYGSRRAARAERACRPYLDSLEPGKGPRLALPFRGGQCAAVYVVSATRTTNLSGTGSITFRAVGPIGGVRLRQISGNNYDWEVFASGVNFSQSTCGPLAATAPQWFRIGGVNSSDGNQTTSITSITPCGPDNCGNPPTDFTPPAAPTTPLPPGRQPFVRSPDVNVDVDVTINPDFSINIDVGTGPITIDPFGDGDGDGGGDGGGDPGDPTDPGFPGDPEGTGAGGEAEGEAPPGTELVGLLVTVAAPPGDANKFANNPKQPYRGIGYVRMGFPGRLGLDISGGTVISPQFFHAQQRGLTAWAVAANTGFDLTVQPYFRDIET